MNWIGVALTGLGLLGLHVLAGAVFGPTAAEWLPDPLVWLLCVAVCWGTLAEALTVGWMLGLARDLLLPDPLGLHSLMLGVAAYPAWQLRQGFDVRRPTARIITVLVVAGVYAGGLAVGRAVVGDAALGAALQRAVLPVVATAAGAPAMVQALLRLPFLRQLERRSRRLGAA